MTQPKKLSTGPWSQGIYEISSTATEVVGTMREDFKGNIWRYAKAGATALAPGKLTVSADMDTDVENCAVAAAAAVGSTEISITVTSTTVAEDYFRGGDLIINDAAGEGHVYEILHSTAVAAGTSIVLTIEEPGIRVALTTSSEATIMHSPWMATVISAADQADFCTGVPMVDVTANYYYWSKTRGRAAVLADEAGAKGAAATIGSSVAGAAEALDAAGEAQIGIFEEAATDTEYYPIYLSID